VVLGTFLTRIAVLGLVISSCLSQSQEATHAEIQVQPLITFVELGSVKCIPCKKMQPVMASIEKKYGDLIDVVFYDVWQPDQKHYAAQYGIRLIPTQVFLDSTGDEIMRHEGFFPEGEIDAFLVEYGLTVKPVSK